MRIIILGLSACLTACAGHITTDQRAARDSVVSGKSQSIADYFQAGGIKTSFAIDMPPVSPVVNRAADASAEELTSTDDATSVQNYTSDQAVALTKLSAVKTDQPVAVSKVQEAIPENSPAEVSYGREDETVFVRSDYKGGDLFTVGTGFSQIQSDDGMENLANDSHSFWHMKMSSAALGAGTGLQAEFAQSSFDPYTSEGFGEAENRLIKIRANRSWRGFGLGLGYQSVGKSFETEDTSLNGRKKRDNNPKNKLNKGKRGTEIWVSRQLGNLGVKTLASVYEDNFDGDDNVSRFTTHKVGGSLSYTFSSWPRAGVTLDYGSGVRASSNEQPSGSQSMEVGVESIASSLYYSDESWSGTLYVENANGEGTTNIANLRTYWLGGSYFPTSTFSVTPSISHVKEEYPEFDVSTDSFATSMTVNYKLSANSRFNFTGYSEYSTEKNTDWAMDSEYMYNSLGVNWGATKPKSFIKKWSLELFHDQYTDNLYSSNSAGGAGFMLRMRSAAAPLRRISDELRL